MRKKKKTKGRRKNHPRLKRRKEQAVSQSEFARLMNVKYGTDYSRVSIGIAKRAGMPGFNRNGMIRIELAEPWWQENRTKIFTNGHGVSSKLLSDAQTAAAMVKIEAARRAKLENDVYERKQLQGWIEIAQVEQFIEALGVKDGQELDALIEDKNGLRAIVMQVLKKYVVSRDFWDLFPAIEGDIAELFRKANDQLKERFRQRAKEVLK